jgi:hypothetical protein
VAFAADLSMGGLTESIAAAAGRVRAVLPAAPRIYLEPTAPPRPADGDARGGEQHTQE